MSGKDKRGWCWDYRCQRPPKPPVPKTDVCGSNVPFGFKPPQIIVEKVPHRRRRDGHE